MQWPDCDAYHILLRASVRSFFEKEKQGDSMLSTTRQTILFLLTFTVSLLTIPSVDGGQQG